MSESDSSLFEGPALRKELWNRKVDKRGTVVANTLLMQREHSTMRDQTVSRIRLLGLCQDVSVQLVTLSLKALTIPQPHRYLGLFETLKRENCAALIHFAAPKLFP